MICQVVPTLEQQAVVDAARAGVDLAVVAGAGTGKTSTLVQLAEALPGRRGRYMAFNKAIVEDSARRLPPWVRASTAHSVAFRAVGKVFASRLGSGRMRSEDLAAALHVDPLMVSVGGDVRLLPAGFLAGVAMRAVVNFAHSADDERAEGHGPYLEGIDLPEPGGRRGWANNSEVRSAVDAGGAAGVGRRVRPEGNPPVPAGLLSEVVRAVQTPAGMRSPFGRPMPTPRLCRRRWSGAGESLVGQGFLGRPVVELSA